MKLFLESRVASKPGDASSWRMLGRIYKQSGDVPQAYQALQQAVQLDPLSAAAHFDFALVSMDLNHLQMAADHFQRVVELAPNSQYAQTSRTHLPHLPAPQARNDVIQAGYEIKRFDGSEQLEDLPGDSRLDEPPSPLSIRIDAGGLYNTNVTLTPTSRSFFSEEGASFQGFLNPDMEYRLLNGQLWRSGPTLIGYFSVNESDFQDLNLQSYQPGWFIERSLSGDRAVLVPRVQYAFTHDEFNGLTFGNRHALTSSVTTYWDRGDTSIVYWTIDYTNFADDGSLPSATSRDGWTNTVGLSHLWLVGRTHLRSIGGGADVQFADTIGSDFTYAGISLFLDADIPLTAKTSLVLEGGWGTRDYFRFELTPSRNENIWRAGGRLQQRINDRWLLALVFSYDRFDSENELFQAQRYVTGVVTTFQY
jgi:hypothetical protein